MAQYVLLQYGSNPFNMQMKDQEGRLACTVEEVGRDPNPIIRLRREAEWAQQHPTIMGPDTAFYYLGPENRPGYVIYGSNKTNIKMSQLFRQNREGSKSRYFTTLSGKDYKWRKPEGRMECVDGRSTKLATWELSKPEEDHSAKLTIKANAMPIVTEILTTLVLNLMAQTIGWPDQI
ncbi:hypothetical protein AX17_002458 [Amanita inopinata Kibby_2008]|nr:hypothetical protein AX17_002458 [Amanita inopinata Kibby_2008]